MRIEGLEHIPREGPIIFATTHESFLDPIVMGAYVPRQLRYMARRSLFVKTDAAGKEKRNRFVMWWMREVFTVIEIDRDSGGREGLRKGLEALEQGDALLLFPEGTRSLDGSVKEFAAGVGLMALRSGSPVIPVLLKGTAGVWPKGRKLPKMGGGPVRLAFGAPVRYEKPFKAEDVAADLRSRVLELRVDGQPGTARDGGVPSGVKGGGSSQ